MILELLTILSAATGVFTGTANCEKMPDGVIVDLNMTVESNQPRVPTDSISASLQRVMEATKTFRLHKPHIVVVQSDEGNNEFRVRKVEDGKIYYAHKTLRIRTTSFEEMAGYTEFAAKQGFTMPRAPEFYINDPDSLQSACIEKATKNALARAVAAKNALNGISMSVLKITDSEHFNLRTSDDTELAEENVDTFFSSSSTKGFSSRGMAAYRSPIFYKIVPTPLAVTASMKILVRITTND